MSQHRWRVGLLLLGIFCIAVGLRVYRLDAWPIFIDEDFFTEAVIDLKGLSLQDLVEMTAQTSRPPLSLLAPAGVSQVIGEPLIAGRAVSIASGALTTLLSYVLGRRVGGPAVGLLTALLYAVSPLAVLHERMFLQDGLLSACSLAAVLVGWRALENGSWRWALAAGALGALAVQIKLSAAALAAIFIAARWIYRRPVRPGAAWRAMVLYCGPLASLVLIAVSPFNIVFAAQMGASLSPLDGLITNMTGLFEVLVTYLQAGLFLLPFAGAAVLARSQPRAARLLVTAVVCWVAPFALLGHFAPSRYYLPALPFALALAAVALVAAWQQRRVRVLAGAATVLVVVMAGWNSARLALDLRAGDLTTLDDWQYRSGWPAGFGYSEAARYVAGMPLESGSSVAYLVEQYHRFGAGFYAAKPPGVHVLGNFLGPGDLVRDAGAPLLLVVDDPRDKLPGQQLAEIEALYPDAQVVQRTLRPHAATGVAVVRLPAVAPSPRAAAAKAGP